MNFDWLDGLAIVLVVVFIITRFFSFKLPRDGRSKDVRRADFSKLFQRHIPADPKADEEERPVGKVAPAQARKVPEKKVPPVKKVSAKDLAGMSGLEKIKVMDPAFNEKKFLEGAKKAYGYYHQCWNSKDEEGLEAFCAPRLVDELVGKWDTKWQKIDVVELKEARIGEARINGRTAMVEAVIQAVLKVGNARKKVVSTWLLARALGSDDPNWELQEMKEVAA